MSSKIKIHFLGTNGWFATETGHSTCHLIDAPEAYIILDAGTGIYKIDQHIIDTTKPIFLFLSHFHLDHVFGLHILNKFDFPQGITIVTQEKSQKILNTICNQPFTMNIKNLPTKISVKEVSQGIHDEFPFKLEAKQLVHISRCFGYRFELSKKTITYCTDTGTCKSMETLARNTDLLIAECSLRPGDSKPDWPHLNPIDSANVALKMKAKMLALIHFDAVNYPLLKDRKLALKDAKTVFNNVIITTDDSFITI